MLIYFHYMYTEMHGIYFIVFDNVKVQIIFVCTHILSLSKCTHIHIIFNQNVHTSSLSKLYKGRCKGIVIEKVRK